MRREQLEHIHEYLKGYSHKLFCGDFNFDSSRHFDHTDKRPLENDWLLQHFSDYQDVWAQLKPNDVGYTFDTLANTMLANKRLEQMRYDRILLSSPKWKAIGIEIICDKQFTEALPGEVGDRGATTVTPVYPSDHFGLLTTLQFN